MDNKQRGTKKKSGDKLIGHIDIVVVVLSQVEGPIRKKRIRIGERGIDSHQGLEGTEKRWD